MEFPFELIWENANPTSEFTPTTLTSQSIGKDLSQYRAIEVYAKNVKSGSNYSYTKILKGLSVVVTAIANTINGRRITFNTDTINIEEGFFYQTYSASSGSTRNENIIPVKIYGLK